MKFGKVIGRAALLLAGLSLVSCDKVDELLKADNPGEIREDQLNDAALANVLANSVIGALSPQYDDVLIWRGSMITDEQVSGINWEATARVSQRVLPYDIGDANTMFRFLSHFRFMGDSVSGRLRTLIPNADRDRRLALTLAHAGYAYTLMAEYMCGATIDVGSTIHTPQELAQMAVPRFQEAITVATAAGANATDVLNLARTGLARAALLIGDNQLVMSSAQQVPWDYRWWIEYQQTNLNNGLTTEVTGGNHTLGVHPRWLQGTFGEVVPVAQISDPRISHRPDWRRGHNALTQLYTPFQPLLYSKHAGISVAENGGIADMPLFDNDTDIALASGVEAMHHYYEAAGPNGTGPRGSTLEFVNERRAYGNQEPVNLSGDELMAELRNQRFKDLYLAGFRLGDLRRYQARGINDPNHTFPSGPHPNADWGVYGDAECWPLPIAEYIGNPNISR
jgi:hypothetical protein